MNYVKGLINSPILLKILKFGFRHPGLQVMPFRLFLAKGFIKGNCTGYRNVE